MTDKSIQVFLKGSQGLFIFLPLLIGAFYLLLGGLAALRALEIGKWYEVGLEDEFHLSEEGTKKSKMRRCVKLNNLTNLIRTNYTFVSYNRCSGTKSAYLLELRLVIAFFCSFW
jgi:hypothetical protein